MTVLQALEHENIIAFHEHLDTQIAWTLVLEHAEGNNLQRQISQIKLSCHEVLSLAIKLNGAVAHMHSRDIIHCDMRAANVVISNQSDNICQLDVWRFSTVARG